MRRIVPVLVAALFAATLAGPAAGADEAMPNDERLDRLAFFVSPETVSDETRTAAALALAYADELFGPTAQPDEFRWYVRPRVDDTGDTVIAPESSEGWTLLSAPTAKGETSRQARGIVTHLEAQPDPFMTAAAAFREAVRCSQYAKAQADGIADVEPLRAEWERALLKAALEAAPDLFERVSAALGLPVPVWDFAPTSFYRPDET